MVEPHPGIWMPEREQLHRNIIGEVLSEDALAAAMPGPGEDPTLTLLGGRDGSGKRTWLYTGQVVDAKKNIILDNHKFEEMLGDPKLFPAEVDTSRWHVYEGWNAGLFHAEASDVVEQIMTAAMDARVNVVFIYDTDTLPTREQVRRSHSAEYNKWFEEFRAELRATAATHRSD